MAQHSLPTYRWLTTKQCLNTAVHVRQLKQFIVLWLKYIFYRLKVGGGAPLPLSLGGARGGERPLGIPRGGASRVDSPLGGGMSSTLDLFIGGAPRDSYWAGLLAPGLYSRILSLSMSLLMGALLGGGEYADLLGGKGDLARGGGEPP